MATAIRQVQREVGPKIEYLEPRDRPAEHGDGIRTIYVLKERVIEHHHTHTGWGFSAFNEFMNKALATIAFICIGGLGLAMLIMAFAVVSRL
ncbi:MAG: hypothetical protein R3F54_24605 [Alphaproteobacteria bacterium]